MATLFLYNPIRVCREFVDEVLVKSIGLSGEVVLLVQLPFSMEEEFNVPAQAMYNWVALVDMPDGGDRPFPLLTRRSFITIWDDWGWARSGAFLGDRCMVPRLELTAGFDPIRNSQGN
eukprot:10506037-Heterocapsa_arctica.AAC.1